MQETLLRAWRHPEALNSTGRGSLRPWLFTVARNLVVDAHRARMARPHEVADDVLALIPAPDEIDRALVAWQVADALESLSSRAPGGRAGDLLPWIDGGPGVGHARHPGRHRQVSLLLRVAGPAARPDRAGGDPVTESHDLRFDLGAYVMGALTPDEREVIDAHLSSCPECTSELDELTRLPVLLDLLPVEEVVAMGTGAARPPADLVDRVVAAAVAERRGQRRRRWVAASAAAVVLIAGSSAAAVALSSAPSKTPAQDIVAVGHQQDDRHLGPHRGRAQAVGRLAQPQAHRRSRRGALQAGGRRPRRLDRDGRLVGGHLPRRRHADRRDVPAACPRRRRTTSSPSRARPLVSVPTATTLTASWRSLSASVPHSGRMRYTSRQ